MSRVYKKLAKKRKSPVRKGPQGDRPWGPFCYACVYLQSISCETLECTAHSVCLSTRKPRFFEDPLSEPSISSELRTVWIGTLHILKGFEKNWVCSINGETIARNFRVLRLTWVTDRRPIYISWLEIVRKIVMTMTTATKLTICAIVAFSCWSVRWLWDRSRVAQETGSSIFSSSYCGIWLRNKKYCEFRDEKDLL